MKKVGSMELWVRGNRSWMLWRGGSHGCREGRKGERKREREEHTRECEKRTFP